jgi:hypothetical protein
MFTFSAVGFIDIYRRQTSPPRLPIIVARVWPPRKRDFPLFPVPIKPQPYLRSRFAPRWRSA